MGSRNKRGPSPTPTTLRVLHGDRASRINDDEPIPASMEPRPPEWFTAAARAVWDRTVYQLRAMGMLYAADQEVLAVYCEAVTTWQEAAKIVDQIGPLAKGRDGNVVKNPAVQIARDYGAAVRVLAGEFGLTPAARVGLSVKDKPSASAGAERILS